MAVVRELVPAVPPPQLSWRVRWEGSRYPSQAGCFHSYGSGERWGEEGGFEPTWRRVWAGAPMSAVDPLDLPNSPGTREVVSVVGVGWEVVR